MKTKIICIGLISMFLLVGLNNVSGLSSKEFENNIISKNNQTLTLYVYLVANDMGLYPISAQVIAKDPEGIEYYFEGDAEGLEFIGELPADENPETTIDYEVIVNGCTTIEQSQIVHVNIEEPLMSLIFHVVDDDDDENLPPIEPGIVGPTIGEPGIEYTYTANAIDPNGDEIEYFFDWRDSSNSGWQSSNTATHTWSSDDKYTVRVKAKDSHGAESVWGTLEVKMPKSKTINSIFTSVLSIILDNHPNMFPLLRAILGL